MNQYIQAYGVALRDNTAANAEWNEAVRNCETAEDYFNLALFNPAAMKRNVPIW